MRQENPAVAMEAIHVVVMEDGEQLIHGVVGQENPSVHPLEIKLSCFAAMDGKLRRA